MNSDHQITLAVLTAGGLVALAIQGLHAQAKPPAYVITEVEIIDQTAYKEFGPKVSATYQPFGGKYLVRGGEVVAMDGEAPKRVVVVVFENMAKAQAWRNSAAWKELAPLRAKAVKAREYIADGFPG